VFLFVISLIIPWVISIGPMRMSIYRMVLVAMILPCLLRWTMGKAGRLRIADIALLLFSGWCALSLIVHHGIASTIQTSGIVFVETIGPYLLARCYIRDANDFYTLVRLLFRIVLVLLPFAIVEFVTGENILRDSFAMILPTFSDTMPPRLELTRVQSVFDHPILFGLCTGGMLALIHLVLGHGNNLVQRTFRTGLVGATSMLSVSSGPAIAIAIQGFLVSWNSLLRAIKTRWRILIGLVALGVGFIKVFSNRSPLELLVSYFLFDPGSYWYRLLIWSYGWASAVNHPVFGVGLNEWERPDWMGRSIDCFWLFLSVTYGMPAAFLMLLAFFSTFLAIGRSNVLDTTMTEYRTGFLITMTAFFLVGWTVHFWDAAYVLFLFLMGSGVWLLDVERCQARRRGHASERLAA
jgi:hypothetical protein